MRNNSNHSTATATRNPFVSHNNNSNNSANVMKNSSSSINREESVLSNNSQSSNNNNNNKPNQSSSSSSSAPATSKRVPVMLQMTPQAAENNRSTIYGTALAYEQPKQSDISVDAIRILMGNTTAGKALLSEEIKKAGFHEKKTWPRPPSSSDGAEMLRLHNKQHEDDADQSKGRIDINNRQSNRKQHQRPGTSSMSTTKNNTNVIGTASSIVKREQERILQWSGGGGHQHQTRPNTTSGITNNNTTSRKGRVPNPPLEAPDVPLEKVRKQQLMDERQKLVSSSSHHHQDSSSSSAANKSKQHRQEQVHNQNQSSSSLISSPKKRSTPSLFQECVSNSSALIYTAADHNEIASNKNSNSASSSSGSQHHLPPSRVPREYWITREHAVAKTVHSDETGGVKTNFEMVSAPIFPSDKPISRMELFALARSLDDLLEDRVGSDGFDLLNDCEAALSNFEEDRGIEKKPGAKKRTKEYIDTVRTVSDVVDIGLCEVVRHAAASCIERGALLDQLRGMIIALFGNLCDRSENDLERADYLRDEIKAAERERDEAREEASNWRKLFFKVNSIGGTSSTKGVTGLLPPSSNTKNNINKQKQQQQQKNAPATSSSVVDLIPTEEECRKKSFEEIRDEVTKRMEEAASEERRIFEEKKRDREIKIEKRRRALELETETGVAVSGGTEDDLNNVSDFLLFNNNDNNKSSSNNNSDDEKDEDDDTTAKNENNNTNNSSKDAQKKLARANKKSKLLRRRSSANDITFDEDDSDNENEDDEIELERDAVFEWIQTQFQKRSHAAHDLHIAAQKHAEVIEKYKQQSMTSALGDLPIEDDSDAIEAELAQQPKSIYQVLVGLLTDVHSAVQATDSLSERMEIEGIHLKHPERSVNVAVRRWRRLAQEIGKFRTENGRRAPIENLKVEFAQLPNPSVVDVLFTLVEISSTLSEMSLRLKAAANAKILDRVTVEPPIPPERPQDPCPLCNRTAPPPESWGPQNNSGANNNNSSAKLATNKNQINSNIMNNETSAGSFIPNASTGNLTDEEQLRRERLSQFLGSENNHNHIHNIGGDLITNLGLGGTKPPQHGSPLDSSKRASRSRRRNRRRSLGSRKGSQFSKDSSGFSSSFFSSSTASSDNNRSDYSSTSSDYASSGDDDGSEWKIIAGDEDHEKALHSSTRSRKSTNGTNDKNNNKKSSSSNKRHHHHRSRSNNNNKSGRRSNKNRRGDDKTPSKPLNKKNNGESDGGDGEDLEMRRLAKEMAEEEEKAAETLKNRLIGATSLPRFMRKGSFYNNDDEDDEEDDRYSRRSSRRRDRKRHARDDEDDTKSVTSTRQDNNANRKASSASSLSRKQSNMTIGSRKPSNVTEKMNASTNNLKPTTSSLTQKYGSRKFSTFSDYSVLAPPSVAGTTRPGEDDDDDPSRRGSMYSSFNNPLTRKNTEITPSASGKSGGGRLISRRSTVRSMRSFRSQKSFMSDGSGDGIPSHRSFISNNNNNKNNNSSANNKKQTITSSGANTNNTTNAEAATGGFISNARQKYSLFMETRCAKLLFLVGMELHTREEKILEAEKKMKATGQSATVQESIDAKVTTWPLELLLQNIHECYEFFVQNGAGKAKDLGEFIAGAAAQKEKLSVSLKPATLFESCEEYASSDERVMNFVQHVIGFTNSVTLRMILQARDKLRLHHSQKLIDVDPELPTKVQITKALRVSEETFDFADTVFYSLKEDLLRNCVPKLSSTDVQIVLDAPETVGSALETALGDRFVPLHLVHTIWRELLVEESAMFKDDFLTEEM